MEAIGQAVTIDGELQEDCDHIALWTTTDEKSVLEALSYAKQPSIFSKLQQLWAKKQLCNGNQHIVESQTMR